MSMITNLIGRVHNTNLSKSHSLLPLFDAVVNSIEAIEETAIPNEKGRILVQILRGGQNSFNFNSSENNNMSEIIGFKVTDNGVGFNDDNLQSFKTFDTDYKANKGCRGVGRLLWLKAFQTVNISSIFKDKTGKMYLREFSFDVKNGVSGETTKLLTDQQQLTSVHLSGFYEIYQKISKKSADSIANSLFEHCLWYFMRPGGCPKISISDKDETINLDDIYEKHMHETAKTEDVDIKGHTFTLTHVKLKNSLSKTNNIAYCAASRLVKEECINGKIHGLFGKISHDGNEFVYNCYVNSDYLNDRVRAERTGFDIEDDIAGLFVDSEISFNEIRDVILAKSESYLSDYLEGIKNFTKDRLEKFISLKAPKYRPILARIPKESLNIDPNISDKDLDIVLHKQLSEIETQLLEEGHNILVPRDDESKSDYEKRVEDYLGKAEDIKKSDLANYVAHRRVILDLLEKAISKQADGKYVREDLIHKLIMPMGKDSNQIPLDNCNLWLIDERLALHDYLASDKAISSMPITGSTEAKEPDLVALNIYNNPILVSEGTKLPLASIVVVEIKRPMRDDAAQGEDKDPIEQALGYLDCIRQGGVQTATGRQIPNSDEIPGFCYVLCDLTPTMIKRCKLNSLRITSDKLGYFGYNDNYKAYIEVISFDRLVNSAKERNKAFFDKLGLPTT